MATRYTVRSANDASDVAYEGRSARKALRVFWQRVRRSGVPAELLADDTAAMFWVPGMTRGSTPCPRVDDADRLRAIEAAADEQDAS